MNKKEVQNWALTQGFGPPDKWGHMKKTTPLGRIKRLKFQKTSARMEVQLVFDGKVKKWRKQWTGYYSQMSINQ